MQVTIPLLAMTTIVHFLPGQGPGLAAVVAPTSTGNAADYPMWHYSGHALVTIIAHRRLSPEIRNKVQRILATHPRFAADFTARMPRRLTENRARTLWQFGHAANWPDRVKRFRSGSAESLRYDRRLWHYITRPVFLSKVDETELPDAGSAKRDRDTGWEGTRSRLDLNIVQAIRWSVAVLEAEDATAPDQAVALCWLFHLVGDVHQPLHAASLFSKARFPKGDKGGNDIQVVEHNSLHAFWDGLVNRRPDHQSLEEQADALLVRHRKSGVEAAGCIDFDTWLEESHELARREVYDDEIRTQLRKLGSQAVVTVRVSDKYRRKALVIGERRVTEAGFRLARVLTGIFSSRHQSAQEPFDFVKASRNVPKPRELLPIVKKDCVPRDFRVLSDGMVVSDTNPDKRLRRVRAHFKSLKIGDKIWGHPCVLLLPADPKRNDTEQRRGRVVIIGCPGGRAFPIHVAKYGQLIATSTGYPTMVLAIPGEYADGSRVEGNMGLNAMRRKTGKSYYNMNCQLALVYIQAMDALQQFLGLDHLQAVIGGHSKRGRSATVAAAMDSRVASVIVMGNEGVHHTDRIDWHLSFHHAFFQEQVTVPVFYLGATNEDGYRMFNVNILQDRLDRKMTIEMIPNYCHSNYSEIQFIDFLMWVSHTFDSRPLSRIRDVTHIRRGERTVFRAKIESQAKVQMVRAWYAYAENEQWSDLMWFHLIMVRRGDHFEAALGGKQPDAFFIEVADIAGGIPGYVSSLPMKISDAKVVERKSRGSRPRLWEPPAGKRK